MSNDYGIRLFIIDCDGTITDGMYHTSEDGVLTKSFYTRDIWALEELLFHKVCVWVVSQANDSCILHKMEGMGRRHPDNLRIYTGVNNKWQHITGILPWVDTGWDEVAYVGDAENDLECIKAARWSACPNDAVPIIKENAKFVSQFNGGRGAVYEFASQILERIKDNVG